MALSQEDRIAISKKIIDIPRENASAENIKSQLDAEKAQAQKADDANKNLMNGLEVFINGYQAELSKYDGNDRKVLTEQNMLDSANRIIRNYFFPNDALTPLPNIPDGTWKFFPPFAGSLAVGKNYEEGYDTLSSYEDKIIADMNGFIATIEVLFDATRSTGDECISGTPNDTIQPSATMQTAGSGLITAVQAWEDLLIAIDALIVTTDTDATRSAQNTAAKDDITNAKSVIDTWQALNDYDTVTSIPANCAIFEAEPSTSFLPSKFRDFELDVLKAEITARQAFLITRKAELNINLGSINQDYNTGDILGGSGFYFKRFRFIDMRLNTMVGSLTKLRGFERGKDAQQQLQNSNNLAQGALTDTISASAFRAPATNTTSVHVLDGTLFSPSDSVYIVSDTQQEISANIVSIDGNRIVLDTKIPEKYRHTENARLYKVL